MAKNINIDFLQDPLTHLDLSSVNPVINVAGGQDAVSNVPASGVPVIALGNIPGVADTRVSADTSLTPVVTTCVAEFQVNGIGPGGGNAAISAGDLIYMQSNGSLDKNSLAIGAVPFGTAFGNALLSSTNNLGTDTRTGQLVASGNTTTYIRVWVGKFGQTPVSQKSVMVARCLYNFAVDGGVSCTPSISDFIPANAIVYGGVVNPTTAVTAAGAATVAFGTTAGSASNSILTATAKASLGLDVVVVPTCVATPFKMSAAGQISIAIATGPLTAGVIEVWVFYVIATNA